MTGQLQAPPSLRKRRLPLDCEGEIRVQAISAKSLGRSCRWSQPLPRGRVRGFIAAIAPDRAGSL